MRGKRMSEKVQNAVNMLVGSVKEPTFTALTSDKIGLLRGLNYYATHSNAESSKKWALEWVKQNMPELLSSVKEKKEWMFSNRGFVCRMISRGYIASEQDVLNLKAFFKALSEKEDEVVVEKKKVTKKAPVHFNVALEQFDYALDRVLCGEEAGVIDFGTNAKDHAEVQREIDRISNDLVENAEAYRKETIRDLKKFVKQVQEKLDGLKVATRQNKARVVKPRAVNPVKMTEKVKFSKGSEELELKGLDASKAVGAKQMIVYDTKYRTLIIFKALGGGFTFTGTTLKNYDTETSVCKRVRKPEVTVKGIGVKTINEIKAVYRGLRSTEYTPKGRFNENMIIVKVSG